MKKNPPKQHKQQNNKKPPPKQQQKSPQQTPPKPQNNNNKTKSKQPKNPINNKTNKINKTPQCTVKASYYKKRHTSIFSWNSNPLFFCMAYDNLNLPQSVILVPEDHCQFSTLSGTALEIHQALQKLERAVKIKRHLRF